MLAVRPANILLRRINGGKSMKPLLAKYFGGSDLAGPLAWLVSLAVAVALYFWLLHLRSGIFDPFGLPIFWHLVIFHDYWAALLMVPVMFIALTPSLQRAAGRLVYGIGCRPIACSAAAVVLLAVGAKFVYHAYPLSMDEYSAWFQGRIFAEGRLTGQVPASLVDWVVPERFQGRFINVSHATGRTASAYWPGFALLITPFAALGAPWLVNPLLAGAILLAVHWLVMRITQDRTAAGLAVLLTAASQAYSVNGISYYSMNAHLLVNLLFAGLLMEPTKRRAILAGALGSLGLTLHNPVPHFLFALPWIAWLLLDARRRAVVPALLAGYLPLCVLLGLGWPALGARMFGGEAVAAAHAGFAVTWLAKLHGVFRLPNDAMLMARVAGLAKLWLWAAPGLPLLAAIGCWRHRGDTRVSLLGWSAIVTIVGFLFVPFDQGHGWGFRYFQSAWGALPVLAALAVWPGLAREPRDVADSLSGGWRVVASLAMTWLLVGTCLRAVQVETFIDRHLAQLPRPMHGPALVTIINPIGGYYARDLVQNDPFLRGQVILATQGRPKDADMMAVQYPELVPVLSRARGQVWSARP